MLLPFLAFSMAHAGDVDTQFIFGFTQGADVGELGEKEIESETVGRSLRRVQKAPAKVQICPKGLLRENSEEPYDTYKA